MKTSPIAIQTMDDYHRYPKLPGWKYECFGGVIRATPSMHSIATILAVTPRISASPCDLVSLNEIPREDLVRNIIRKTIPLIMRTTMTKLNSNEPLLYRIAPGLPALVHYQWGEDFRHDLVAGLSVAAVALPTTPPPRCWAARPGCPGSRRRRAPRRPRPRLRRPTGR